MSGGDAGNIFAAALARTGTTLTLKDLVERYPPNPSLTTKPIVLEQCKFFDLFDVDPAEARESMKRKRDEAKEQNSAEFLQQALRSNYHHPLKKNRKFDFRLEPEEKDKLATNGVVASHRLQARSFGDIYYQLYTDDLPVFVTSDSILHAWHRSFDAFLVELEEKCLYQALSMILNIGLSECVAMAGSLPEGQSEFAKAIDDVVQYLAIGLSLLQGQLLEGYEKLSALWLAVLHEKAVGVELFSAQREVDFSQFKPRGHYTLTESLKCYFRAMMWLGIIDFRFASGEGDGDLHQLLCAVILVRCLQESGTLDNILHFDSLLSSLVADCGFGADSLSVKDLVQAISPTTMSKLMEADQNACTNIAGDEENSKLLLDLQHQLVQHYTDHFHANADARTSFALLGQRFVWSEFIFSRLVYDQVMHDGKKQTRRIPSAVDAAFTLFGNNGATRELCARMEMQPDAPDFVRHRDGIPFASNLVALREMIDEYFASENDSGEDSSVTAKTASVSTLWLQALRALSEPSPNAAGTFHSGTWQHRLMNTQIASFTQLRHDTVLYATQPRTMKLHCEYPDGMVDPYPLFWQRMREMALRVKSIAKDAQKLHKFGAKVNSVFDHFALTVETLGDIAICQAAKKELDVEQMVFLRSVMERMLGSGGATYGGWYPNLFYHCHADSCKRNVLVVDIHTDCPSARHGDHEGVLHLGVGDPVVGVFIVDSVMYAGPLFSSYEFVLPIDQRLTDKEFQALLPMEAPQWARQSYLCSENLSDEDEESSADEGSEDGMRE